MTNHNTPIISVIVPTYNVAPYLERCLRSLANQDISNEHYEILCVNDGSTDHSKDIVENLQKEIPNLILINQENQGVSKARNNAISSAKGKYILPIDGDDYVAPNSLNDLLNKVIENDLDVLYAPIELIDVSDNIIFRSNFSKLDNTILSGHEAYMSVRGPKMQVPDRSAAILYKAAMLKKYDIQYPTDVPYLEDGVFLGKVFSVAQRVGYSNANFYYYIKRPGSATNSSLFTDDRALNGFKNAILDLNAFRLSLEKKGVQINQGVYNQVLAKFVFLGFNTLRNKKEFTKFKNLYDFLHSQGIKKLSSSGVQGIYAKLIPLYNTTLKTFYQFLPLRRMVYRKLKV